MLPWFLSWLPQTTKWRSSNTAYLQEHWKVTSSLTQLVCHEDKKKTVIRTGLGVAAHDLKQPRKKS